MGNFDAVSAIEAWDLILTGRTLGELERDDAPRTLAEEPFLTAFSAALQRALAAADRDALAQAVAQWIEQGQFGGYDPELFTTS